MNRHQTMKTLLQQLATQATSAISRFTVLIERAALAARRAPAPG